MTSDLVERLRAFTGGDSMLEEDAITEAADELERLRDRIDDLEEALQRIAQWSEAYPLDIFREPDFKKAHEVLKANGMTIDAISASAARHVVEGLGKVVRAALTTGKRDE